MELRALGLLVVVLVLLVAAGCRGAPRSAYTVLGSVREAVEHPDAERIAFTGEVQAALLGRHTWRERGGSTYAPRAGEPDPNAMWVVPVADPGQPLGPEVTLWLTPSAHVRGDDDPGPWLERVRAEVDGQAVRTRIRGRARDQGAGWASAIADAEARHGLRSHPDAAVAIWPPKD